MKKTKLLLLMMIAFVNFNHAQTISILVQKKMDAWKQSKLYVVKTVDEELTKVLETSIKASFPNYAGTVSVEESEKLMNNENNFLAVVYYFGSSKQKKLDRYNCEIAIVQANEKKLKTGETEFYRSILVHQSYMPVAPNLNVPVSAKEAGQMYTVDGFDKTFDPAPNIIAMIPSTVLNFKQYIDEWEKTKNIKEINSDKKWMLTVSKDLSENAKILKNKTLLVLNNPFTEDFYNAYEFKKEKIEKNDLSKIISKDKGYCFLKYYYNLGELIQVSVIDCETGLLIYTANSYASTAKIYFMTKEQAVDLNNAVNGKFKVKK